MKIQKMMKFLTLTLFVMALTASNTLAQKVRKAVPAEQQQRVDLVITENPDHVQISSEIKESKAKLAGTIPATTRMISRAEVAAKKEASRVAEKKRLAALKSMERPALTEAEIKALNELKINDPEAYRAYLKKQNR